MSLPLKFVELMSLIMSRPIYSPVGAGRPPLLSLYLVESLDTGELYLYYQNTPIARLQVHEDGLGMACYVRLNANQMVHLPIGVIFTHVRGREYRITPLYHGNLEVFAVWLADRAEGIVNAYTSTKRVRGVIRT